MLVVVGAHENGNMTGLVVDVTCQSWTYSPSLREAELITVGRVVLHTFVTFLHTLVH